jgi:hypothetical protein
MELQKVKTEITDYKKIINMLLVKLLETTNRKLYNGEQSKAQPDKVNWVQIKTKNNKKHKDYNSNLIQITPNIDNVYELLPNLKEDDATNRIMKKLRTRNTNKFPKTKERNQSKEDINKMKHKVLLIGDSHAKKCAAELRNNLDSRYETSGMVKPGVKTNSLIVTWKNEIRELTDKDIIVFWGGANNVSTNNTCEGLKNIMNFIQSNRHTNVILVTVPHRYDLPYWSCVNSEIETFNKKLKEIMRPFTHVKIVKVEQLREYFTKH